MSNQTQYTAYVFSGRQMTVDLLTNVPDSTDMSTWKLANWLGYQSQQMIPQKLNDYTPLGIVAELITNWTCRSGSFTIRAIGVSCEGSCVAILPCEPSFIFADRTFTVRTLMLMQNWIPPR